MKKKFKRKGRYFVYIVKCKGGTYYIGFTPDIDRRIKLHNSGRGAKYTRDRRPVRLVWRKEYKYFKMALKMEKELKKLTHSQKHGLVKKYRSRKKISDCK